MPRFLQFTFAGIVLAVLIGGPIAYVNWRDKLYGPEIEQKAHSTSTSQPAKSGADVTAIPVEPASQESEPAPSTKTQPADIGLFSERTPRMLTLHEAIASSLSCAAMPKAIVGGLCPPDDWSQVDLDGTILIAEIAYWELHEAYGRLRASVEMLRTLAKGWQAIEKSESTFVRSTNPAPFMAKYQELRYKRYQAVGEVLDAERNLRGIMGICNEDGTRLVPGTPPLTDWYRPNYDVLAKKALVHPKLEALRTLIREAEAALPSELAARSTDLTGLRELLQENQHKAGRRLDQQYQKLAEWYERYEATTEETKAYTTGLKAIFEEMASPNGKYDPVQIVVILFDQLGPAMCQQKEALSQYNQTRAWLEYCCGSLARYRWLAVWQAIGGDQVRTVAHWVEPATPADCDLNETFEDAAKNIRWPNPKQK